jgi:N6-adenosine-specific RNA methylase IME4
MDEISFVGLQTGHYGAILADPPWRYEFWGGDTGVQARASLPGAQATIHYQTMGAEEIAALPVASLAAPDCVLFLWVTWPTLKQGMALIEQWGFTYKTCAFAWMKANGTQVDLFREEITASMRMGYWTRANSEVCLLATRGKPKRINADVRQGIIEPARQHSRKPDCVHDRIERLVAGPYCELFARAKRPGWDVWGNQTEKFKVAS